MAKYELTFLFDKSKGEMVEKLEEMLGKVKAKDVKKEDWGVKPLTYKIAGLSEAHFVHFRADINPSKLSDLNRFIRLDDRIIRDLVVRV